MTYRYQRNLSFQCQVFIFWLICFYFQANLPTILLTGLEEYLSQNCKKESSTYFSRTLHGFSKSWIFLNHLECIFKLRVSHVFPHDYWLFQHHLLKPFCLELHTSFQYIYMSCASYCITKSSSFASVSHSFLSIREGKSSPIILFFFLTKYLADLLHPYSSKWNLESLRQISYPPGTTTCSLKKNC